MRHRGPAGRWRIGVVVAALAVLASAAPTAACSLGYVPDLPEIAQRSTFIALVEVESMRHPTYRVRVIDVALGDVRPGQRLTVGTAMIENPTDSCDLVLHKGERMVLAAENPDYLSLGTSWAWHMSDGEVTGITRAHARTLPDLLARLERLALVPTDAATRPLGPSGQAWWLALPAVLGASAWVLRSRRSRG